MKQKLIIIFIIAILFYLTGCNWFADNPMFPTAKFIITSDKSTLGQGLDSDGNEIINREVVFTFIPINKVGAIITNCEIIYKKTSGETISSLTRNVGMNLSIYDISWQSGEPIDEEFKAEQKIEIYGTKTEGYLKENKIASAIANVKFTGNDMAGHPIEYKSEILIETFSGIEEEDVEIYSVCSKDEYTGKLTVAIAAQIKNALSVEKVVFSANEKSGGTKTIAPYISDPIVFNSGIEKIIASIAVYDILGNIITKSKEVDCSPGTSPTPLPSGSGAYLENSSCTTCNL